MCTFEELLQNEGKRKWIAVGKKEGREEGREEGSVFGVRGRADRSLGVFNGDRRIRVGAAAIGLGAVRRLQHDFDRLVVGWYW